LGSSNYQFSGRLYLAFISLNFDSGIFDRKEELIDLAKLSSMAAPVRQPMTFLKLP
jgi:hypothetical protein